MINFSLIVAIVNGSTTQEDIVNIDHTAKTIELPTKGTSPATGNIIITVSDDKVVFDVFDEGKSIDTGTFRNNIAERVYSWLTDYYL